MSERATTADTTLRDERTIDASRERVFAAFTEPALLERWYAPRDGWETVVEEADVRPGGTLRIRFGPPGRQVLREIWTYHEVVRPDRLVYSCSLEDQGRDVPLATRVTVELRDLGERTGLVVTEEGYPTADERDRHADGWARFMDRLARAV